MSKKFLYLFKEGHDAFGGDQTTMKNILGGKGAGLAEMTHAGMPVPQGFTITTEACTQYYEDGRQINAEIMAEIMEYIEKMEPAAGFRSFRCTSVYARHDGYHPEPGPERPGC